MKDFIIIALMMLALSLLLASVVPAEDWRTDPKNAREWKSYNDRSNSQFSDYDNDGIPNNIDRFDNDRFKPEQFRDYDNDGVPNVIDPYDNKKWVPKGRRR